MWGGVGGWAGGGFQELWGVRIQGVVGGGFKGV